jgi:hypothetical protein
MAAEARVMSESLELAANRPENPCARALAELRRFRGPVLVDLDETLFLRNSTEDFIDTARPGILALLLMRLLDVLRPWRWSGGERTRDVWRVRCILLLLPWTRSAWNKRCKRLAAAATNAALMAALEDRARAADCEAPIIVTVGFEAIVRPLVEALKVPQAVRIVAARHSVFSDRREGKLALTTRALGAATIKRALVITDSDQDADLLEACAVPLLIKWPQARFAPALRGVYLPGQYMTQVKRPGQGYISRGILQEDYALWVLASLSFTQPVLHVVGLLFLLLSFWAVYERGYVDNDEIAARYERDPTLNPAFYDAPVVTPRWAPWGWALVSGAIGVAVLRGVNLHGLYAFGAWMAVLLATYATFLIYNRRDKQTRIWLYAALQLARGAAFIAVVSISVIGAVAIGAHVLSKWVPYYVRRQSGQGWPKGVHFLPRLLFFVLLSLLLAFATGYSVLLSASAALLLAWNVFRARHELTAALRSSTRTSEAYVRTFY